MSAVVLFPLTSSTIAVGDPAATRTVYMTTIALVLLGVGLGVLAWWLFRRTRPEPELFAPLEEMETRSWRKLDPAERAESLDAVRPWGARPVSREDTIDEEPTDEGSADDVSADSESAEAESADADDEREVGADHSDEVMASPDDATPVEAEAAADDLVDAEPDDRPDADADANGDAVDDAATDATPTAIPSEHDDDIEPVEERINDGGDLGADLGDDVGRRTGESDEQEDDPTVAIDRASSN